MNIHFFQIFLIKFLESFGSFRFRHPNGTPTIPIHFPTTAFWIRNGWLCSMTWPNSSLKEYALDVLQHLYPISVFSICTQTGPFHKFFYFHLWIVEKKRDFTRKKSCQKHFAEKSYLQLLQSRQSSKFLPQKALYV